MRIAVAADHAGFPFKQPIVDALVRSRHEVLDLGTDSTEPVDYPEFAHAVGLAVREGRADLGVLICGSGAGVSIAANKLRGVRAALCHDLFTARQAREDDDANVICLGARVIGPDLAVGLVETFVAATFSGAERHVRRLARVREIEAGELPARPAPTRSAGARRSAVDLPPVREALGRLERLNVVGRIWAQDPSLWSDDEPARAAIRRRLGWLPAPEAMRARLDELRAFAEGARRDRFTDAVLLGMGGSSLAPEVLAATFGSGPGAPGLSVLDTTDPATIRDLRARLKLERTLVLVASKSGTTVEVQALAGYFRQELEHAVRHPGDHLVAITDPGTSLDRQAAEARFRHVFLNDPDIGGRFSALSFFGLVPGALIGVDVEQLLADGASMAARCRELAPLTDNPGVRLGAILAALARAGRDKVTLVLSEPIRSFGAWLEQLLTESTGKQGRGLVVVHDEPLGPPEVYGDDRVFVGLVLGDDPAVTRPLATLEAVGHPVVTLTLGSRADLGGEFFRWEFATAVAGALLEINPFDEPNVAEAKSATAAALGAFRERGRLPDRSAQDAADVARALAGARPGDYLALLAYLPPTPATTAALQGLRQLVRDRTRLATTVGYGPRYLHSTGQLHKGGPPSAILLLFTADDRQELPIPGEAYGFGILKQAQALGDVATLEAAGRRVLWLPLGADPAGGLERLGASLARSLG